MKGRLAGFIFLAALVVFLLTGIRASREPALPGAGGEGPPSPALRGGPELPGAGFLRRAWTPPPTIGARSALVGDLRNGEVFFEVRADADWPIASLTKLMTAAVVLERFDLERTITLAESDFALGRNSSHGTLAPGETYAGRDLLALMLLPSANEAAEAFARVYGRDEFVAAMNATAAGWGLARTHFTDPSGLARDNRSTAAELLRLAIALEREYPDILALTRAPATTVTELTTGARKTVESSHELAGRPDFLGGKTGTTLFAGENLITAFSYGSPALIIILGDTDRFGTTVRLFNWFTGDFKPGK